MPHPLRQLVAWMLIGAVTCALFACGETQRPTEKAPKIADKIDKDIAGALPWLLAQQQKDGSFIANRGLAIQVTAQALDLLTVPPQALSTNDPRIQQAITFLLGLQQADGSFEMLGEKDFTGRDTALSLLALSRVKAGSPEQIKKAQEYLFSRQNSQMHSPWEGGIGSGNPALGASDDYHHENLVSVSAAIRGLLASGVSANDPHLQRALGFISRCQDVTSSSNQGAWVTNSGRGIYSPPQGDGDHRQNLNFEFDHQAERGAFEGLLCTSMLVTDYLELGLSPTDPRVALALKWLQENTVLEDNRITGPLGQMSQPQDHSGIFAYYATLARMYELLDHGVSVTTLSLAPNGVDIPRFNRSLRLRNTLVWKGFVVALPDGNKLDVWLNSGDEGHERRPQVATVYAMAALKSLYRPSWPE